MSITASERYLLLDASETHPMVELWSIARLPFEPKGWLRELRHELRLAVSALAAADDEALCAVYASADSAMCDTENVLFYNVGASAFESSASDVYGLSFERSYAPPPAPGQFRGEALHYHCYRVVRRRTAFTYWDVGHPLARWTADTEPLSRLPPLASVWRWIQQGEKEIFKRSHDPQRPFGLRLRIGGPLAPFNLAALVKPLIDGAISAFHAHDGSLGSEVAARLAAQLGVDPVTVARQLSDSDHAILGRRRLVWPWRTGVQWNPADDLCVACEITTIPSVDWHISGELFEVSP